MSHRNRYGLSPHIPAEVARIVRKECGFGCAMCGTAFVQYHHFDPPFHAARQHRPEGIILLCPTCHTKFGSIPAKEMRDLRLNPRCKQTGFLHDANFLFRLDRVPEIVLGDVIATTGQIIRHGDRVVLGVEPPHEANAPFGFVCELRDERNDILLRIRHNMLLIGANHYDIESTTKDIIIRRKPGHMVLGMSTNRLDRIEFTHLETFLAGGRVSYNPTQGLCVTAPSGGRVVVSGTVRGKIGVWLRNDGECWIAGGVETAAGAVQRWI